VIMGSLEPWYEAVCLAEEAASCTTIEYNKLAFEHPGIICVYVCMCMYVYVYVYVYVRVCVCMHMYVCVCVCVCVYVHTHTHTRTHTDIKTLTTSGYESLEDKTIIKKQKT